MASKIERAVVISFPFTEETGLRARSAPPEKGPRGAAVVVGRRVDELITLGPEIISRT